MLKYSLLSLIPLVLFALFVHKDIVNATYTTEIVGNDATLVIGDEGEEQERWMQGPTVTDERRQLFSLPMSGNSLFQERVSVHNRRMSEDSEIKLLETFSRQPLLVNHSQIMFWRPQKVGSSTILSFLMSFGYRYNLMPRRKDAANSFCSKIAQCAFGLLTGGTGSNNSTSSTSAVSKDSTTIITPSDILGTSGVWHITTDNSFSSMAHAAQSGQKLFAHGSKIPYQVPSTLDAFLLDYIKRNVPGSGQRRGILPHGDNPLSAVAVSVERADQLPMAMSTGHQLCNLRDTIVHSQLKCAFQFRGQETHKMAMEQAIQVINNRKRDNKGSRGPIPGVKELFVLRDPLSRSLSIFYFWGELFKLAQANAGQHLSPPGGSFTSHFMEGMRARTRGMMKGGGRGGGKKRRRATLATNTTVEEEEEIDSTDQADITPERRKLRSKPRLGGIVDHTGPIHGTLFAYHGNESTVPPLELALAFARNLPLQLGMPGPSYTWSAFSDNPEDAVKIVKSDRIMTIVTERLDESLVVASHYLGWSLADVVVTVPRKALSTHPKSDAWPAEAITIMKEALEKKKEYAMYRAANEKLTERIATLGKQGVNVPEQVKTLQALRKRTTELCLSPEYLEAYRRFLSNQGLERHFAENKLRDAADEYSEQGHCFSFNKEILYSFDVCGNCEAHAILFSLDNGLAKTVETGLLLKDLDGGLIAGNVHFTKCPKPKALRRNVAV